MKKTAVITGGSKGIGRAIVQYFLKRDFKVITCSRDVSGMKEWGEGTSGSIVPFAADLSKRDGVNAFIKHVHQNSTTVNVLINNAGLFMPGEILKENEDNFHQQMNLNVNAAYYIVRGLKDTWVNGDTFIANICSTASFVPYTNGGSYCISKFALLGLTKVLREELKERRIAVTAVMPGATLTNSWKDTDLPKERFMQSENVANAIGYAYENRKTAVVEEIVLRPMEGDL